MTKKTVHGCTCIKDWVKINGKIESGCIYGGVESKTCPATKDRRNASKENCSPGDLPNDIIRENIYTEEDCGTDSPNLPLL